MNMADFVKVEFVSTDVRVISGKRRSDGADYTLRKQEAFLHNGHHYPDRFEVTLGRDAQGKDVPAYSPGFYTITPASIQVNREYSSLELSPFQTKFIPIADPKKA